MKAKCGIKCIAKIHKISENGDDLMILLKFIIKLENHNSLESFSPLQST